MLGNAVLVSRCGLLDRRFTLAFPFTAQPIGLRVSGKTLPTEKSQRRLTTDTCFCQHLLTQYPLSEIRNFAFQIRLLRIN